MKLALQKSHKSIRLLQDVELNDFTVLTGVNGAGKSHLLEAIENGSIKVDGIASGGNLIRRFDWSNLVPNDTQAINPYTLIQERDNHWKDISSQITRSRDSFKQFLEQIKITNKSDDEIKQMASMTELELSEKLSDHQKAHQIYVHYKSILDNFKKQYSRNNKIIYLLIERFEKVCSTPFIYLDEDEFYKYYFAQCNPVNIFQQSFGRLFAAYEKLRVENEFREFRNQRKGQNIGFLSEQEFKAQNGEPPWDFVNDILETADLDFRIDKPDGYNNKPYQPRLIHQISGDLINFSNLSSGEKILISFALFLYYAEDKNQIVNYPKILLFDEIDAPLHPSMTQSVINTIQEVLINKHKIKVILTTHSPSTVALSPESSIYVMTKDENNRLQETSKDSALAVLTAGITTLSINYENRRQIFVESKNDIEYYELIFNKIKQHLIPEISLSFISAGTKGENCEQVKSIVKQLVDCGNSNVYGIIDWDSYHASKDNIKVLGENKRYSIENYIFDPLLLVTFLLREKIVTREELGLKQTFIYTDILKLNNSEIQKIVDWIISKVKIKLQSLKNQNLLDKVDMIECQYISKIKIMISAWYLQIQGHSLEGYLKEIFPQLKKFHKEEGLKLEILSKVFDDLPDLLSKDFVDLFLDIQNN